MTRAPWPYRLLLRAFPPAFRARFERDMAEVARDRLAAARQRGRVAVVWCQMRLAHDLVRQALAERRATRRHLPQSRTRRIRMMMSMRGATHDLRLAVRGCRARPAFTTIVVLTLALGIGASTAIFSLAHAVWLKPLPYADPERLVTIRDVHRASGGGAFVSAPEIDDYRRAPALVALAAYAYSAAITRIDDEPTRIVAYRVSPNLFEVLGVEAAIGRTLSATGLDPEDRPVLLSDATWRRRFGADPAIVGRTITLYEQPHTVVGVMPRDFRLPQDLESEIWLPMTAAGMSADRTFRFYQAIGRLAPGMTLERARADLAAVAAGLAQVHPASNGGWTTHVSSLVESTVGGYRAAFLALLGAVGLFLTVTCANVAGLLLSRLAGRQADLAVLAALGASRAQLARQLLVESLVLTLAGALVGLGIASGGSQALAAVMPDYTPRIDDVRIDAAVMGFAVLLSVVTAVICAIAPILRLRIGTSSVALRDARRHIAPMRQRLQSGLIVAQIALSVVLLTGAGLMTRTFIALVGRDRGFATDRLLTMSVSLPQSAAWMQSPQGRVGAFQELMTRVSALPGVADTGAVTGFPGSAMGIMGLVTLRAGTDAGSRSSAAYVHVASASAFRALGAPMLAGRAFSGGDTEAAPQVAIISRTLASRLWPDADAVGRRIALPAAVPGFDSDVPVEVVGVVADTRLGSEASPDIYLPLAQTAPFWMDLLVRTTGEPGAAVPMVRDALRTFDRDVLIENVRTMDHIITGSVGLPRAQSYLLGLVAVLAAVLSGIGLYGLLSFLIQQRGRELAIRLALGATPGGLSLLVARQGLRLVLVGIAFGVALTVGAARWLTSLLPAAAPLDPWTLIGAAALILVVAVAAVWSPARRVVHADPMAAMT